MTDKRKKILCIVGALLSVLLIAGAGIWGLASRNAPEEDSAVQEVMSHIREKDYMRALYIYNMQVKQEENGTQKMETLMQEYIAELDSEYRSGRIILSDYTERCGQMLNIRRTSALVDQIQTQLTALMNERYTQYMSVKDTDDGTAYSKAETVFRVVLDSELDMTFWDAEEKRSHMKAINDSRYAYETGLLYEQKATYSDYIKALESYKQVHKDSPRYSEAQTAITRCSNAFREMTLYILEVHYSNPDIYSYQSGLIWGLKRIEDDLKVLPDDAVLTAKYTEWKQLLVADVRSEADKALADKDMRYWDKWTKITQALTYVPDDEKLLAAKASLIEPMKQEFCKELRWHMGDLEWSYCDRISDLAQRIPGDRRRSSCMMRHDAI
ncbi:MAG: hypothetical protein IJY28_07430 [Clostridia bacterium]|nr:hypothetical protein [Clostridia bacterium]